MSNKSTANLLDKNNTTSAYTCAAAQTDMAGYTWSGIVNGITGLIYPAGDAMLKDQKNKLSNLQNQLTETQTFWDEKKEKYKDQLTDSQKEYMSDQLLFIQTTQAFNKEILEDTIHEDTLLIQIIMGILIIIIIYLVFL